MNYKPYPLGAQSKVRETYDYSLAVLWIFTINGNLPTASAMEWLRARQEDCEYGEE